VLAAADNPQGMIMQGVHAMNPISIRGGIGFLMLAVAAPLSAAGPVSQTPDTTSAVAGNTRVAYQTQAPATDPAWNLRSRNELVLSAPPRDSEQEGMKRFGPIADYLSGAIGKKVVYRHAGNWGIYQGAMQKGEYDLVFDGPHFNGWRMTKLSHNVLVKLPGEFTYVGFVGKGNTRINSLKQLAGHKICAHAPPNLGTLIMLDEFDNPARQPVIVAIDGYDNIYKGLLEGKCTAAMLPLKHLQKHDKDGAQTRTIFRNKPLPQQAFSAGPRISREDQAKITAALLAPEAEQPLANFRQAYGLGKGLVPASNEEYTTAGVYLRDQWGYY